MKAAQEDADGDADQILQHLQGAGVELSEEQRVRRRLELAKPPERLVSRPLRCEHLAGQLESRRFLIRLQLEHLRPLAYDDLALSQLDHIEVAEGDQQRESQQLLVLRFLLHMVISIPPSLTEPFLFDGLIQT